MDGHGWVTQVVRNLTRREAVEISIFRATNELAEMSTQFRRGISPHCDGGEVPQVRDQQRNVIRLGLRVLFLLWWRGEQESPAVFIQVNGGSESHVHGGALLPFFGPGFGNAKFAARAELCNGAEQALRRFWEAKRRAELHHGLIPIAR